MTSAMVRREVAQPSTGSTVSLFVLLRLLALLAAAVVGVVRDESVYQRLVGWDSGWYRGIAADGYGFTRLMADGRTLSDYAFFPLYPGLERLLASSLHLELLTAGLVVSSVSAAAAAAGIFAVCRFLVGASKARLVVVLWAVLPIAMVTSMAYSESLFTALASWALYATLREWYVPAGCLAILCGLTRPTGAAVVAAVMVAAALAIRRRARVSSPAPVWSPVTGGLLAPAGLLGYLGWVGLQRHSLAGYFEVTDGWGNTVDGGAGLLRWTAALLSDGRPLLGVLLVAALATLLGLTLLVARGGYPAPVVVYTVVAVLMALTTSGYFGSKPRYLLPVFPLLLPVVDALDRLPGKWRTTSLTAVIIAGNVAGAFWLFGPGPP